MSTNQPAHFPRNPIVAHLEAIQRINAENGRPAGRNYAGGGPVDSGIPSRVSSAAMSNEVPEAKPLSPEERAERDRLAQQLGIVPKDEVETDSYPDLDSALAAGESVKPMLPDPMAARKASVDAMDFVPEYTARALLRERRPRLIDFKRVQSINLMEGFALVDDFEIEIPDDMRRRLKKEVLDLAVSYVTRQLTEALMEVLQDGPDGKEGVQTVLSGVPARSVSPRPAVEGRTTEPVQELRSEEGLGVEPGQEPRATDEGSAPTGEAAQ